MAQDILRDRLGIRDLKSGSAVLRRQGQPMSMVQPRPGAGGRYPCILEQGAGCPKQNFLAHSPESSPDGVGSLAHGRSKRAASGEHSEQHSPWPRLRWRSVGD